MIFPEAGKELIEFLLDCGNGANTTSAASEAKQFHGHDL